MGTKTETTVVKLEEDQGHQLAHICNELTKIRLMLAKLTDSPEYLAEDE